MPNRLADETSPYLRQHGDNPVDWYPWSDDAFALARELDKPVFLSVGYSSCHWCHVMAHESFEDAATAEVMNELFVNVKVDREERPDVDAVYMQAVQALTGRGGWPMSVWCTPDGRPFYGGTYYPNDDRHGMPSFARVCEAVAEAWRERRDEVLEHAGRLTEAIDEQVLRPDVAVEPVAASCCATRTTTSPRAVRTELRRLRHGAEVPARDDARVPVPCVPRATGPPQTLEMITTTLDAMAAGGMYDQVGGGFARYSTDDYWLVPHFEKMLYDNALLARAYLHAYLAHRRAAVPPHRRRDDRVRAARPPPSRGRLLRRRGRRLRRHRRQVLPLEPRRDPRGLRRRRRRSDPLLRRHRRRELRRSAHAVLRQHPARRRPRPRSRPTAVQRGRERAADAPVARASGPASTTRSCSPGTRCSSAR